MVDTNSYSNVSIGSVFSRATSAAKNNPGTVLVTWLAIALFSGLWQWLFVGGAVGATPESGAGFTATFILGLLASVVMTAFGIVIMTLAVLADAQGRKIGIGEALGAAARFILPTIGFCILWYVGTVIGLVLLVVPGLILLCMWAAGVPALIAEGRGVVASFGRSAELTKGHRWKVFGMLMVVVVAYYLFLMLLGGTAVATGTMSTGLLVVMSLVGSIIYLIWGLVSPALYVELVQAKEGLGDEGLREVFA